MRDPEDFGVHHLASGFTVEGEGAKRRRAFLLNGRRQPDTAANDHRRRPTETRNPDLPDHIARLAPLERQAALGRDSLTGRATKFRPVLGLGRPSAQREEQEKERQRDRSRRPVQPPQGGRKDRPYKPHAVRRAHPFGWAIAWILCQLISPVSRTRAARRIARAGGFQRIEPARRWATRRSCPANPDSCG